MYVSAGESWIDPSMSYVEHHKAGLLATLVADVGKIRRYVELKDQSDFVVAVDVGSLTTDGGSIYLTKHLGEGEPVVEHQNEDLGEHFK